MEASAIEKGIFSGPKALPTVSGKAPTHPGDGNAAGTPSVRDTAEISSAARRLANRPATDGGELHLSPTELRNMIADK